MPALANDGSVPERSKTSLIETLRVTVSNHPFFFGLLLMLATTSLWALAFVAPIAVPGASAVELSFGRFIVYGLISLTVLGIPKLATLPISLLRRAVVFALAGNIAYYTVLVLGIQMADATIAVLIIGMLPVTVSIAGTLGSGSSPPAAIAAPISAFGAGVVLYGAARTDWLSDIATLSVFGVGCILSSLAMWTWYAVANARFLKHAKTISATEWSSVIGVASLCLAIVGLIASWSLGLTRHPSTLEFAELSDLAIWSVILGGGATWLGTVLFNIASRLLDVPILGQLILFEAVFGTIYVFLFMRELPGVFEVLGIVIALGGLWWSVRTLQNLDAVNR